MEIVKITSEEAKQIIDTREREGLFYLHEEGKVIGIDNTTGDAWTEEFDTEEQCFRWLRGEEEIDDEE
jgi:uncharacterized protein YuzE